MTCHTNQLYLHNDVICRIIFKKSKHLAKISLMKHCIADRLNNKMWHLLVYEISIIEINGILISMRSSYRNPISRTLPPSPPPKLFPNLKHACYHHTMWRTGLNGLLLWNISYVSAICSESRPYVLLTC